MTSTTAVIGAGIVGLSIACRLREQGRDVVLFDPSGMEDKASYGNAGSLSPATVVPMSMPGTLRQIPHMLLASDGPLSVRWRHVPALARWTRYFARACTQQEAERIAAALTALLAEAPDLYTQVLGSAAAARLIRLNGSLTVFRTASDWNAAAAGMELRRRNGIAIREVSGPELRDLDPALRSDLYRGVLFPQNGQCVDTLGLLEHLMAWFRAAGGRFEPRRITALEFSEGRLTGVRSAQTAQTIPADSVVIAAGAGSVPLARQAGDRVPVASEFGYHVMVPDAATAPQLPTMDAAGKFVVSPMTGGVRVSGVAEFAPPASRPDWGHARRLMAQAGELYPGLRQGSQDKTQSWRGARPSTPDSLPVIGRSRRSPDVIHAFGHGHLGLTAAPMTARIVGDLLAGRRPEIDIAPFDPRRF